MRRTLRPVRLASVVRCGRPRLRRRRPTPPGSAATRPPAGAGEQAPGEHARNASGHAADPCREVGHRGRTGDECDRGECPDRPHPVVVLGHEPEHRDRDQGRPGQSGDQRDDRGDPRGRGGRRSRRHPAMATMAAPASHSPMATTAPRWSPRRTGAGTADRPAARTDRTIRGARTAATERAAGEHLHAGVQPGTVLAPAGRSEHVAEVAGSQELVEERLDPAPTPRRRCPRRRAPIGADCRITDAA